MATSTPIVSVGQIGKLLVHLLGPALTILATATAFNPTIAAQVAVAILAGIPVYWVSSRLTKTEISAAVVVVQGILAWFGPTWGWSHPSWQSWVALFVSALVAGGVLVVPNAPPLATIRTVTNVHVGNIRDDVAASRGRSNPL